MESQLEPCAEKNLRLAIKPERFSLAIANPMRLPLKNGDHAI